MASVLHMKDYTKFFTPDDVANYMVSILYPIPSQFNDFANTDIVLEPSAGNGALVKALKRYSERLTVIAIEIDPAHKLELKEIADSTIISDIFNYDLDLGIKADAALANPPFGHEDEIDGHLRRICEMVKYHSDIVTIVPQDYHLQYPHHVYPINNWATNNDGTVTPIKIIKFKNPTF